MKECLTCNVVLPLSEFRSNGYTPNGTVKLKPNCKGCDDIRSIAQFEDRLLESVGGKENMKCSSCGYNKCIAALDFHHLDETTKEHTIARMRNMSLEKIKKEVSKCIVLCANCHRELHYNLRN